jgi:tripartite-type tricarboxylate transporter receptor subunit TctC
MKKNRRNSIMITVIGLWVFLFQTIGLAVAKDPDYPTRPITFYIQYGPGGASDIISRAFMGSAAKFLGQPVTPVNKPGASGAIAATAVMNAKPDGYTLGMVATSNAFVAPFSEEAPYKDLSGFTMIVNFGYYVYPLMVKSDAPWKTWNEFIEWAKKNPRAAKIGNTGPRSVTAQGLVLWQVEKREQVEFTYITFKSSAEVLNAILGGHVNMFANVVDPQTVPYIKEGKLRILSYGGSEKVPGYENIPSFQELYGFTIPNLMGVCGPKGLPDYVLKKLDDAFAKAVKEPEFIHMMSRMYTPIVYMDRGKTNQHVDETFHKVGEIMKVLKAEEAKEKK